MDQTGIILSVTNLVVMGGILLKAGRYVQLVEDHDKELEDLRKQKTEVALVEFKARITGLESKMESLNENFTHFVDYLVSGDKRILRHFNLVGKDDGGVSKLRNE